MAVSISDLAEQGGLVGGPFGSSLVGADYVVSGIPVIRGSNMQDRYIGGSFVFVTAAKVAKELARNTARPGDLVFTQRGTLGQVAMVPNGPFEEYVVSQSQMRVRVDPAKAVPAFVYYACTTPQFRRQIDDKAIRTGVPHTNLGILASLEVPRFRLSEQAAIAEVLGALDDKIAASEALHAVTGQLTATLFYEATSLLPQASLSDYAQVNASSAKPGTGTLRYLDIASVDEGSYESPTEMDWSNAPGRARRRVQRGDTVWSTVRPNRRSHALILEEDSTLICSTGLVTLTPKSTGFSFVHEASRTAAFTDYLIQNAKGSAYPAVNAQRFAEAPVPQFDTEVVDTFNALCDPLWERAAASVAESRTLAQLRDTLLPALMDGRLRVRDAIAQAEDRL